jgi:hypothetical protein
VRRVYRNYDIEITATRDGHDSNRFTPIVEIQRQADGQTHTLLTSKNFNSAEGAEAHGMEMAQEWINEHLRAKRAPVERPSR